MLKIDELENLAKEATPGPWEWDRPDHERANIVYYEPFTDGSPGKGSSYDLISRDSGCYGPDVPTCEYIMAANPNTVLKLIAVAKAAEGLSDSVRKAENAGIYLNMNIWLEHLQRALAALEKDDADNR